jgi:hypothetical protein
LTLTVAADAQRYCNPLPLPSYPVRTRARDRGLDVRSLADPTVIRHDGKWYLYATGGMVWVSEDFIHWQYRPVSLPGPTPSFEAPTVAEFQGSFYLAGNGSGLYRSSDPLGPWELVGSFQDNLGKRFSPFDPMIFPDKDGRVYFYYSGGSTKGIYGVELDPKDLTHFAGAPVHLFGYESSHVWERTGDANEDPTQSWIEGPWMTEGNGVYYLQYSAPGTQWKTYSVGVYTSRKPLGPFVYDTHSPILHDRGGLLNGAAHHSVVEGPGGTLWMVYHILFRNRDHFERRVAMDPVGFDAEGRMFVHGPTETPQWAPGVKEKPWLDNDSGSLPITINRETVRASSSAPGRDPVYAIDNNVRTWWEAEAGDAQPSLTVDLTRPFSIDSARILFSDNHLSAESGIVSGPYQYKLETSADGKEWKLGLDKTANAVDRSIAFDEIPPVRARWVRLTVTGAPHRLPVGLLEFTVFGKP